ncbi:glycosyltransferase [Flavobacterium phycosphaerae]|uniref:glycosyltransferase n=1 Tax=Flavobacterium phycosphaerae TaxID=2697515 RepID=UPI001389776A|nr:glycosyltransferase [Flavobacterium phycosphaerae]
MPPKIKVLHIIKSLGRGGAEMLLPETIKVHDQSRFEFHCIYFLPWKDQMVPAIEKAGGKVTCFSAKNNLTLLFQYPKIVKYCKENNIQLIHAHLPWAGIVARIAGRLAKLPVLYTEHNNFDKYHILTKILSSVTYKFQTKVLAVSEDAKAALERRNLFHDIVYVPNGVNTDFFSKTNHFSQLPEVEGFVGHDKVIGTVAVFRKQKRLDIFIEVAHLAQQQKLPFKFLMVGAGTEMPMIQALVEQYQLNNVMLAGIQENPADFMQYMDVFLITSDFEGLPVALLESMSMEIVPFCTNVGGIPNVVNDNRNGVLLKSNQPAEILSQLETQVLNEITNFESLKKQARNTVVADYSIQRMVNQLETIYTEVLQHER